MKEAPRRLHDANAFNRQRRLVWLIAGSLIPYVVSAMLLVVAFGPGRGNRSWLAAALLAIAIGLIASALLRLVVLRLTGRWATASAPRRAFALVFVVIRVALAILLVRLAF